MCKGSRQLFKTLAILPLHLLYAGIVMKKLFVGGIAWGVDDKMLREHFEKMGPVLEARVIYDRETGRSRGFGFVTFEHDEDAERAKNEMNETLHEGRIIRVNDAIRRTRPPSI